MSEPMKDKSTSELVTLIMQAVGELAERPEATGVLGALNEQYYKLNYNDASFTLKHYLKSEAVKKGLAAVTQSINERMQFFSGVWQKILEDAKVDRITIKGGKTISLTTATHYRVLPDHWEDFYRDLLGDAVRELKATGSVSGAFSVLPKKLLDKTMREEVEAGKELPKYIDQYEEAKVSIRQA